MSYIYIVPIELDDHTYLEKMERFIFETFHKGTKIEEMQIDLAGAFDPKRVQHNSSLILQQLIRQPPPDADKVLGVLDVDLFIPILTFVFGEAELSGDVAIVSYYRLQNERYGLEPDSTLLLQRLLTESLHEIGHLYGLTHCHEPVCVMRSSTSVEEIDLKSAQYCQFCRKRLPVPTRGASARSAHVS